MKLPPITPKQQTIIELLYQYRFLHREHLQQLLGHKDKRRISSWLKDLREKHYIAWVYDADDFIGRITPASYYLDLNGIRYLKQTNKYAVTELRKRYREHGRSSSFIARCLLVATVCIDLQQKGDQPAVYICVRETEFREPNSIYHFMADNELITPQLIVTKQANNNQTTYLLEILDSTLPHYRLRKRLKNYVDFLRSGEWESQRPSEALPTILLVCSQLSDLIYAKRRIKQLLDDLWDTDGINIQLTTTDKLRVHGLTSDIWELVLPKQP